jgi:signal transduction histidine kinase
MAHELNNPATAVLRGAEQLRCTFVEAQKNFLNLHDLDLSNEQLDNLLNFSEEIQSAASSPNDLDALERSDRETEIEEWLEGNQIEDPWDLAPTLVNLEFDVKRMMGIAEDFSVEQLPAVISWITNTYTVLSLIEEIGEGAGRISEIVNALKSYSYLDQAPTQEVDVHDGIDNTLVLLRNKLKEGVVVQREYAQEMPKINAHGSELNQVWTNLIDNAIDAMDGKGELTIRTSHEGKWVTVEIIDNGEGIPPEIQENIFDVYFTTKPSGKGTGLGLDISRKIITDKHLGEIKVDSTPGETIFTVKIPYNFEEVQQVN